jgi:hypothetical protein
MGGRPEHVVVTWEPGAAIQVIVAPPASHEIIAARPVKIINCIGWGTAD